MVKKFTQTDKDSSSYKTILFQKVKLVFPKSLPVRKLGMVLIALA
jgi:hypothetical protein